MGIHEECGVFGIINTRKKNVAEIVYYGLYALQHRGQESCGIVVNDEGVFTSHKDLGLVSEVFTKDSLSHLPEGTMAVGHVRYGTTGGTTRNNCQPIEVNHQKGKMAVAHNGNLSNASGIPYGIGLIKNKYIGRTFISPSQNERLDKVRIKLSPVKNVIDGKRVVLIDDSIVRGTTSRQIVKLLRDAGAREIHMRISAPPFLHPCYYGTDIDSEENLIACHHSTEEIAEMLGVNSLGYLEISQLGKLIESEDYCAACFNGRYPTRIPIDLRKDRFERKLSERKK